MVGAPRSRGFTALKIEGGILPPEFLQSVAALQVPQQTGSDYGLSPSLAIKEELARYWRIAGDLHSRYADRHPRHDLETFQVGVEEWLIPLLQDVLGYADLTVAESVTLNERVFRLSRSAFGGAVPLLLATRDSDLDKADSNFAHDGRRQAPHVLMQEYLNAQHSALWGIVSNGLKLRLLRDNASLTRPSYIEADLDLMFTEGLYPDFTALWLIAHASRLKPADDKPSSCIIESWRTKAHETGERVRENLRDSVTCALRQLGNGFLRHRSNSPLLEAIESGALSAESYFQQLLRLVYRLLFLFTVEERNLLHAPSATDVQRAIYSEGYALSRLRERALRRRHYDRNVDLWRGLRITFSALADGAPGLGLPALGGLFRSTECIDLDQAAIANEDLLEAIRALAFFRSGETLARVNYRDMDTEELGSVYESLLELLPVINVDVSPWIFAFIGDNGGGKPKGTERKLTGSYYTPPSLVGELVRSTLDPVIAQALAEHPGNPRAAILALRVVDPACGSGHFLLTAARRLAAEIARIESGADTGTEAVRQRALREVVRHCIYGVDRNLFAVELCKTALWMETVEPGKPLTFLDSHIMQGDSLTGILNPKLIENGIPDAAYNALTGDDKVVCQNLKKRNREHNQKSFFDEDAVLEVAVAGIDLDAMPENTLDEVERKREAWETIQCDQNRSQETLRSNLFVGAYFAPKKKGSLDIVPQTQDVTRLKRNSPQRRGVQEFVRELDNKHHFFHWHLAFAEIMQDGGFDAVLGNPPWERIKLQEKEFFGSRSPEIASAPNAAARNRLIQHLNHDDASPADKKLFRKFRIAKREAEAASQYARTGGRFPLTGFGDLNTYAVFAETFLQLLNPRGRAGLIVPTGIATDHSTKAFFDHITSQRRLVSLFDFENREKIFPGIDSRIKFCLLTLSGTDTPVPKAEFAFFLHQAEQLKDPERRFTLAAEDFSLFNPNTRTCPIFRTRRDMEIARKMYERAGVFWREANDSRPEQNPWGVKFSTMFHMSNDSGLFRTQEQMQDDGWELEGNVFVRDEERYLPLYEAKLFHQYDHRFATLEGASKQDIKKGKARAMTVAEKSDPDSVVIPRYWISETEVEKRLDKSENTTQLISRAEPSRAEPSRAEPSRAEPSRAEPSRAEPSRAEPSRAEPSRAEPSRAEPSRAEPSHYTWKARRTGSQLALRKITRATDERTEIFAMISVVGLSDSGTTITVGSSRSETSQVQQTREHPFSRSSGAQP